MLAKVITIEGTISLFLLQLKLSLSRVVREWSARNSILDRFKTWRLNKEAEHKSSSIMGDAYARWVIKLSWDRGVWPTSQSAI